MQKNENIQNHAFVAYFERFMPHPDVKSMFLNFQFLEKSQLALRGITGDLLQNNLRLCKNFLEITNQDFMQEN
jgi:hypothetical protein